MKTAMQMLGVAIAKAVDQGMMDYKNWGCYILTYKDVEEIFLKEGFNVRESRAWVNQIKVWSDLGYVSLNKANDFDQRMFSNVVFNYPSDISDSIMSPDMINKGFRQADDFSKTTGQPIAGGWA